ncbi:aminopeptidase P family protein, partial [Plantibacter sp. CFBP 13570]|nr:aminopeptidase P family protein [Plantibacter sp. CFBP 13570]
MTDTQQQAPEQTAGLAPATTEAPATSMPRPANPDPKLPRLAEVPAFREFLGTGWGTPDRTPPV